MANRLQHETSPYLLQHRDNPVDWYPWGKEALDEAARSGRPVFLSIGYSACHWCHVMERESFEDEKTAAFLNENFVNIKVDREERPDLDSIYMDAVQAMTGHGGWPMSVFLSPDGKPFYGGTYYPPEERHGMPSFQTVLAGVLDAYQNRREDVARQSDALLEHVQRGLSLDSQGGSLNASLPDAAVRKFHESFDGVYGGFGSAPKFPQPMNLDFLMRYLTRTGNENARDMITLSLEKMAGGGIYDQIGGGFHRYSVDAYWLVPHFEKMLYDNALLARLYLHAFLVTGNQSFRRITEQTLDYILREMTDPSGGFYSSQDADSEGEEGTFFLWSPAEIRAALQDQDQAELLISFYDVTDTGNFEGRNILHQPKPVAYHAKSRGVSEAAFLAQLDRARDSLYKARAKRIAPGRDDKVIASWNGLALAAFAEAARYLNRDDYRAAAVANGEFLANEIIENKRYRHTWKNGRARFHGYLEDYAYCGEGFLALYAATFDERWFTHARDAADGILAHFADDPNGGFYDTADDHEKLVTRPKAIQDNAVPSGNAMALGVLARLASYTGEARYREPVHRALAGMEPLLAQYPNAFGHWLGVLEYVLGDPREIAVVVPKGGDTAGAAAMLSETYRPGEVVALKQENASTVIPLLEGRGSVSDRTTVHVCRSFTCQLPITDPAEIRASLTASPGL